MSLPPGRASGVLVQGYAVAGHAHWGVAGGIICVSIYLHDSAGLDAANLAILRKVGHFLLDMSCQGYTWIVGGDFNVEPPVLTPWLNSIGG
eukprot:5271545-Pyramimonas_sp.AAC.1